MSDKQPLLESYDMNGLILKNRVIMAPMTRSRSDNPEFVPTEIHVKYYTQRAGAGLIISEGYSKIKMIVRPEMMNGLGIVHGGIAFSMADSAFAFACNNRNNLSVALDTSINFLKPVHVADILVAEATEIHNGKSTGLYEINIQNQKDHLVAKFKGLCYRTGKELIPKENIEK